MRPKRRQRFDRSTCQTVRSKKRAALEERLRSLKGGVKQSGQWPLTIQRLDRRDFSPPWLSKYEAADRAQRRPVHTLHPRSQLLNRDAAATSIDRFRSISAFVRVISASSAATRSRSSTSPCVSIGSPTVIVLAGRGRSSSQFISCSVAMPVVPDTERATARPVSQSLVSRSRAGLDRMGDAVEAEHDRMPR